MTVATLFRVSLIGEAGGLRLVRQDRLEVQPRNGTNFGLHELYELLDCKLIEIVHLNDDAILVCDEEGKFTDAPVTNLDATEVFRGAYPGIGDWIAGTALLAGQRRFGSNGQDSAVRSGDPGRFRASPHADRQRDR